MEKNNTLIRIASRGSPLALWQSHFVGKQLEAIGFSYEITTFKTTGDIVQDRFLHEIGGKGLFTKELEEALLLKTCDIAVHSLKDMPANVQAPFILAVLPPRHTPCDALILNERGRSKLPKPVGTRLSKYDVEHLTGATIATSSLRRSSILNGVGINTVPIRGNVDTRLKKVLESQDWEGLVLAEASLDRLTLKPNLHWYQLDPEWFIPCAAQGALAIEALSSSAHLEKLARLDHKPTRLAVSMERAILSALGGDCTLPFGGYCHYNGNAWNLQCAVYGPHSALASASLSWSDEPVGQNKIQAVLEILKSNGVNDVLQALGLAHRV